MYRLKTVCLVMLWCCAFLGSSVRGVTEYIQVSRDNVNIRSRATTDSQIVAKANQGDIFELEAEQGNWYQIHLFSGESRFIYKSLAGKVLYEPGLPEDPELQLKVYVAWKAAGERARQEAETMYPLDQDPSRNLSLSSLLEDRYRLEAMQQLGVPAPAYRRIIIEGNRQGW